MSRSRRKIDPVAPAVADIFLGAKPDANGDRPLLQARYRIAYGGRGSAKSWGFARMALMIAATAKRRILCARELQVSIGDSVHKLLSDQIDAMGLAPWFEVQNNLIRGANGSEFIFTGIRNNATKIKSTEGVDICWVEEAEGVSERSWEILIPTIRKPGSEIWVTFNPDQVTDPTYRRFVTAPPPRAIVRKLSWRDNPWFSDELREEKDYLARVDPDAYEHVWEGGCRTNGDAQVLRGKYRIEHFDSEGKGWDGPYFGVDWGFAQDPSVLVRCWIDGKRLMIDGEAYGIGVEMDDLGEMFKRIPGATHYTLRADNARPETISYVRRTAGLNIMAADKWPGSIEDGVQYLRRFEEIVIHPICRHTAEEARLWSYKRDRLTGDVLPELIDKHNHCWDAIRYGLSPMIRNQGDIFIG